MNTKTSFTVFSFFTVVAIACGGSTAPDGSGSSGSAATGGNAGASSGAGGSSTGGAAGAAGAANAVFDRTQFTNMVPISANDACNTLVDALAARANQIPACNITVAACPEYITAAAHCPINDAFDQGEVMGCAQFIGKLTTCDELVAHPCTLTEYYTMPCMLPADGGAGG
jgi:hypothetical protein